MDYQKIESEATVLDNRRAGEKTIILTLKAPDIAAAARPGQFVNLACGQFLRRPIGVMRRDKAAGTIDAGIRIQGDGTAWLGRLKAGDKVSCLGPLGHGFELDGFRRIITVGGGTGVFPLYFVQQACRELGIDGIAICGYRSRAESILTGEYAETACGCLFASDSGDMDIDGHAAGALEHYLREHPAVQGTAIMTCGPLIMMKSVAAIARACDLPCQVSLEERMACGIGVCLVCACKTKEASADGGYAYRRCCADGPVFPAEDVEWSI